MDIIQCLEARGCHHLISLIFSRLSSPELTACSLVSRRWGLLVQQLVWANPVVRGRVLDNKQRGEHTSTEHRLARSELSCIGCGDCKFMLQLWENSGVWAAFTGDWQYLLTVGAACGAGGAGV